MQPPSLLPRTPVPHACTAICTGIANIQTGVSDVVIAGGVETFSDVPIRFSRPMRSRMLAMNKAKGMSKKLGLLSGLKLKDLAPEAPGIANFTTGEVMGHSSDRLADRFGVSRSDQDEFSLRSHVNGAKAHADGLYEDEIIPFEGSIAETGIRGDAKLEKLASLKPAFVKVRKPPCAQPSSLAFQPTPSAFLCNASEVSSRELPWPICLVDHTFNTFAFSPTLDTFQLQPHGTVTAANASYLTDGAAATLLMSEEKALELGFTPKAYLRDFAFVSCDPFEELLLGPTYAATKVLQKAGLKLSDIDVIEFHEAFAGQVGSSN